MQCVLFAIMCFSPLLILLFGISLVSAIAIHSLQMGLAYGWRFAVFLLSYFAVCFIVSKIRK
jgi:hypothetical protein